MLTAEQKKLVEDIGVYASSDAEKERVYNRLLEHFTDPLAPKYGYSVHKSETALGVQHVFRGPGLPQHANSVHLLQTLNDWAARTCAEDEDGGRKRYDCEADAVLRLIAHAHEAGYQRAKAELRRWLG